MNSLKYIFTRGRSYLLMSGILNTKNFIFCPFNNDGMHRLHELNHVSGRNPFVVQHLGFWDRDTASQFRVWGKGDISISVQLQCKAKCHQGLKVFTSSIYVFTCALQNCFYKYKSYHICIHVLITQYFIIFRIPSCNLKQVVVEYYIKWILYN